MNKILTKLNKKLSKGLKTLIKFEQKNIEELLSQDIGCLSFFVLHFGIGSEGDFIVIDDFLKSLNINAKEFDLYIYPGYPYGYIQFITPSAVDKLNSYLQDNNLLFDAKQEKEIKNEFLKKSVKMKNEKDFFFLTTKLKLENLKFSNQLFQDKQEEIDIKTVQHLGLFLYNDIFDDQISTEVYNMFKKGNWENIDHKRVQSFGYRYIPQLNQINKQKPVEEIPEHLKKLLNLEILKKYDLEVKNFDQCSLEEFKPGKGCEIKTSHGHFNDQIIIISMFAGIKMKFESLEDKKSFSIIVPKNSLLILTNQIRTDYKYIIEERRIDFVNKTETFRKLRYQLTFRQTKENFFCDCKKKFCDFTKIQKDKKEINLKNLNSKDFEQKYVKDVYNAVAEHFSHTRYKPWPSVKDFIHSLPKYSLIGDMGCGNGKYIFSRKDVEFIGTDIAHNFCLICKKKNKSCQTCVADTTKIPFRSNVFDYIISIAVIHHLSSEERRMQAVKEFLRIVKIGGEILIYVWAYEQEKDYGGCDIFVPWNNQQKYEKSNNIKDKQENKEKNTIVYKRYYHLFKENELKELVEKVAKVFKFKIEVVEFYYSHQNWAIRVKKLE